MVATMIVTWDAWQLLLGSCITCRCHDTHVTVCLVLQYMSIYNTMFLITSWQGPEPSLWDGLFKWLLKRLLWLASFKRLLLEKHRSLAYHSDQLAVPPHHSYLRSHGIHLCHRHIKTPLNQLFCPPLCWYISWIEQDLGQTLWDATLNIIPCRFRSVHYPCKKKGGSVEASRRINREFASM